MSELRVRAERSEGGGVIVTTSFQGDVTGFRLVGIIPDQNQSNPEKERPARGARGEATRAAGVACGARVERYG